uniref:Uncharacterized protein n=1 Tax=Tanacetum cinerariifolium TaxID=118510 RepID=A0A699HST4_TANCI|nr:hypothetical protein [Tanacetum cinerariifolium]
MGVCVEILGRKRGGNKKVCEVSLALWDVRVWLGLLYELNMHYMTRTSVLVFASSCDTPQGEPILLIVYPLFQILDLRGAIPSKTVADAKVAIQEMADTLKNGTMEHLGQEVLKLLTDWNNANPSYQERRQSMEDTLSKFMSESTNRHKEKSILIKEIRASTDAVIRNQKASIKTLEIQIGQMSKVLQEKGFRSLPSSTKANREIKSSRSRLLLKLIHTLSAVLEPPIRRSSVSVMPLSTYLNLGLGKLSHTKLIVELADKTVKYPKGIAKNMLVGIGKFIFLIDFIIIDMPEDIKGLHAKFERKMELDLEARLMGETLVLNRSLDPFFEDYIELNDLHKPIKLRRNQGNELMPTIKECKVVEEFRARNDARMDSKVFGYHGDCDHDKKIHIDCAYNLMFFFMIDFAVLEDMDAYRNEGMGDVIFGESFLREVETYARRFDGMITIYNGNDKVTYQIAQSLLRFKHHTNKQCNKIPPLLKEATAVRKVITLLRHVIGSSPREKIGTTKPESSREDELHLHGVRVVQDMHEADQSQMSGSCSTDSSIIPLCSLFIMYSSILLYQESYRSLSNIDGRLSAPERIIYSARVFFCPREIIDSILI